MAGGQENTPIGGGPAIPNADNVDAYLDSFPPGYRFCPHDEELILHYLKRKVMGLSLPPNRITEVNLYSYNPERLAELHKHYGEMEWYFFTPRERKYPNGTRPNRAAGDGYWRATGADQEIKSEECVIGYRKVLVFHRGKSPKGDKSNWIMHEFTVNNPPSPKKDKGYNYMRLDDYVLCRIFNNKANNKSVRAKSKTDDLVSPHPNPIVENEDHTNQIMASDDMIIDSSVDENLTNQMLPEEALNDFQDKNQRFGRGDLWSAVESFVDYPSASQIRVEPSMNFDLPPTTSNAESREVRNEEFKEEESMEEYRRKFNDSRENRKL